MRSPLARMADAAGSALARRASRVANPTAQAPVSYVATRDSRGMIGDEGNYGREAQVYATGSNGTLFSIINVLSTGTASIDWHLHSTTRVRSGTVCPECEMPGVRLVESHPALSILDRPNDYFTRQELVESVQQHIDLVGEGWMTVEYLGSRPIGLWPVRPDRMAPVRDPINFLDGYVYRSPDGTLIPLRRNEVIYIRVPAPWDVYRGAGAVQTLMNQLWGARYAAEWNRRFFENSALPGGLIELPNNLDDTEFDEFQERWAETHRGVNNAHTVGLLEAGAKWVDLKYTQRDMEFTELRRVTREEMREAFGIHGHILGLSEDVNRANAEAADVTHARRKLVPRADRWKGALNNDFLRLFGDMGRGYEFVYCSPVPEDEEAERAERDSKANAYKTLVDAGVHPEDAATLVGYPVELFTRAVVPSQQPALAPPAQGGQQPQQTEDAGTQDMQQDGMDGGTAGGMEGDGAATDLLRTWAPVKLAGRALPAILNRIHDDLSRTT